MSLAQKEKFYRKGKAIFRRLERRLRAGHRGEVIAIDPSTGAYVIGKDALEAALKAREQFKGQPATFFRIGFSVVHKLRNAAS